MPRYVALLRAVNVGGTAKLPMKDLATIVAELGGANVRTYIQSGNVVFEAPARSASKLPSALEAAIEERFGFRRPVILRSATELHAVLDSNPFIQRGVDTSRLYVGFLQARPSGSVDALDAARSAGEEFELDGKELYLHFPIGVGRTRLTNQYIDRVMGTVSTIRNWRTVLTLASMAAS